MEAYLRLVTKLTHAEPDLAFPVLIRFYELEMIHKTKSIDKKTILSSVVGHLLSVEESRDEEIEKFAEFFAYTDFGVDFALAAEVHLGKVERNEVLATNVLNILSLLTECLPDDEIDVLNCMDPNSKLTIDRRGLNFVSDVISQNDVILCNNIGIMSPIS